jgi:hypothetical protein
LYEQQQALNRQQQMAAMLMQQGQQAPQGQMISGRYVAPSFTQNLANLAQTGVGAYLQNKGDKQALELATRLREGKLGAQQALMEALNAGDTKKALSIATADQYGAGKEFIPALIGSVIPKTPDEVAKFNFAKTPEGGNFKGSFAEFQNQMTPYQKESLAIERQKLANQGNGANLTEFQGKATNFGVQMAGSIGEMAAVEKSGFNPASSKNQALLSVSGTTLGNYLVPPEAQRYKQAMDNFTESFIRFKSGANVPMSEIEKDLKNMMPQPGDLPDKLEQKQRSRERALQGMAISAGPGAKFISEAYKIEAPGMKNEKPAAPAPNATKATPSLWGKATIVGG